MSRYLRPTGWGKLGPRRGLWFTVAVALVGLFFWGLSATPSLITATSADELRRSMPAVPAPDTSIITATDDQLGTDKWSAGPAAAFFYMKNPWVFTVQGRQLWSFAGDSSRPDVNQMVIQPIIMYGLGNNWALVTDMVIVANWKADSDNRWTVPLGGGLAKFLTIGNQPLMARLDAYYNVERPVGAPDWSMNFLIRLFFPR